MQSVVCVVALAAVGSTALADMSPLADWNLICRTNLQSASEVDGSAIIGGNITGTSNYSVQGVTASGTGLAVGGNIGAGVTVQVNNGGNLRISGSVLGTALRNGGGALINDPGISAEVAGIFSNLNATHTYLNSLAANGTVDGAGNMNAVPTNINGQLVAVYSFNQSAIQGLGQLNLNFGAATSVIINVNSAPGGTADFIAPPNLIGGFSQANSSRILWNFTNTSTLLVNNTFNGAVIALDADLQLTGGAINGSVAVNSVSVQNAEIRRSNYGGFIPNPGAGALLALAGLAATRRRR